MESLFGPCLHVSGNKKLVPWLQSQPEAWLLVLGGLGIQPRESVKSFFAFSIFLGEQCYDATLCSLEWKDIEPVKHSIFGAPPQPPTVLDIIGLLRWVGNKVGWTPCFGTKCCLCDLGNISLTWLTWWLTNPGEREHFIIPNGFWRGKTSSICMKSCFPEAAGASQICGSIQKAARIWVNWDYKRNATFALRKSLKNLVTLDSRGNRLQPRYQHSYSQV